MSRIIQPLKQARRGHFAPGTQIAGPIEAYVVYFTWVSEPEDFYLCNLMGSVSNYLLHPLRKFVS